MDSESSPGVRRMQALVGQEMPFNHGREQMKVLAGLEVTTKAWSARRRPSAARLRSGNNRRFSERSNWIYRSVGEPIPVLYVQMDGTGVPVVKKQTEGRKGKTEGQPAHTREAKLGCVFTQTTWDEKGYPIRDPHSTTYTGAIETAEEFGKRIYLEAFLQAFETQPIAQPVVSH